MTDWTVDKLTNALDTLWMVSPNTSVASLLDEAASRFGGHSTAVREAHKAFQQARYAHKDAYARSGDETGPWQRVVDAGAALAQALREVEI